MNVAISLSTTGLRLISSVIAAAITVGLLGSQFVGLAAAGARAGSPHWPDLVLFFASTPWGRSKRSMPEPLQMKHAEDS